MWAMWSDWWRATGTFRATTAVRVGPLFSALHSGLGARPGVLEEPPGRQGGWEGSSPNMYVKFYALLDCVLVAAIIEYQLLWINTCSTKDIEYQRPFNNHTILPCNLVLRNRVPVTQHTLLEIYGLWRRDKITIWSRTHETKAIDSAGSVPRTMHDEQKHIPNLPNVKLIGQWIFSRQKGKKGNVREPLQYLCKILMSIDIC